MSKNEITGDNIITKPTTEKFSDGWDTIWGCPNKTHMGEFACKKRSQCWEPCGDLGKNAYHAQVRRIQLKSDIEDSKQEEYENITRMVE